MSLYAEASASTPESGRLTHVGPTGKASMVDVGDKKETMRGAVATGRVALGAEAFTAVRDNILGKGDVLGVARMAGIMAAKQTSSLIPLCHSLNLDRCTIPAFKSQVRLGQCSHVCVCVCLLECSTGEWLLTSCLSDIVSHRGSHDARSMLTIKLQASTFARLDLAQKRKSWSANYDRFLEDKGSNVSGEIAQPMICISCMLDAEHLGVCCNAMPIVTQSHVSRVSVDLTLDDDSRAVDIRAEAKCQGRTGVEMEAMTAVSIAALTVYDMTKAISKGARIDSIRLEEKWGGKSGHWKQHTS